jgi:hypothetical protein
MQMTAILASGNLALLEIIVCVHLLAPLRILYTIHCNQPCGLTLWLAGRDVPVFLERSVIDFRCVMVDQTYREKLIVRNGGKTAMKVGCVIETPCKGWVILPKDRCKGQQQNTKRHYQPAPACGAILFLLAVLQSPVSINYSKAVVAQNPECL